MSEAPLILVIDDDTSVARFITFKLSKKGYRVKHIDNGSDGLDAIRLHKPDLVILDMMMPGIDGREVAEQVKEHSLIDLNRIIILSGKEMTHEIKSLFDKMITCKNHLILKISFSVLTEL